MDCCGACIDGKTCIAETRNMVVMQILTVFQIYRIPTALVTPKNKQLNVAGVAAIVKGWLILSGLLHYWHSYL